MAREQQDDAPADKEGEQREHQNCHGKFHWHHCMIFFPARKNLQRRENRRKNLGASAGKIIILELP
jgi:hypothetical protein